MADRKVYVDLKVRLVIRVDEGTEVQEVVDELEYDFCDSTGHASVEDQTIRDFEVVDSK